MSEQGKRPIGPRTRKLLEVIRTGVQEVEQLRAQLEVQERKLSQAIQTNAELVNKIVRLERQLDAPEQPVPMIMFCPSCSMRHIDEGEWATKPHHTHACQHCGVVWRPAVVNTVGARFLPGFKNRPSDGA